MSEETAEKLPDFNSHPQNCIVCGKRMFYSEENLVHVCLEGAHGALCYFEPDQCWFAASKDTAAILQDRGIKFHFIPPAVFENANLMDFVCDQKSEVKTKN